MAGKIGLVRLAWSAWAIARIFGWQVRVVVYQFLLRVWMGV